MNVTPFETSTEFRRLLAGDAMADLTRIALEIATDARPELDQAYYLDAIDSLAVRVAERCPRRPNRRQVLRQLNWVLYIEEDYRGNVEEYDDPRQSYLDQVIDRRVGLPITLSILYRGVAERLGVALAGVNLPAHFMLRLPTSEPEPAFIDPYNGGLALDRAACCRRVEEILGQPVALDPRLFEPCSTQTIVARLLRNLKVALIEQMDFAGAWTVQQRLSALLPNDPIEARDLGFIALQTDRPGAAIRGFEAYLSVHPDATDGEVAREYLRLARRELAIRN